MIPAFFLKNIFSRIQTDLEDKLLSMFVNKRMYPYRKICLFVHCVSSKVWLHVCECQWKWQTTCAFVSVRLSDCAHACDATRLSHNRWPHRQPMCPPWATQNGALSPAYAHKHTSEVQVILQSSPDIKPPEPLCCTFNVYTNKITQAEVRLNMYSMCGFVQLKLWKNAKQQSTEPPAAAALLVARFCVCWAGLMYCLYVHGDNTMCMADSANEDMFLVMVELS